MLSLTKKVGYGLIAMVHLARETDGKLSSAREIAEHYGLPGSLLMNILKELASAGVIESVRGARGGYRLAGNPEELSLVRLIEVLEGPVCLMGCARTGCMAPPDAPLPAEGGGCSIEDRCPVRPAMLRLHEQVHGLLDAVTLADLTASSPPAEAAPLAASPLAPA